MSKLTKQLHILKTGGTEETVTLYNSTDDCKAPYLSFSVDGANAYAKLGETTDDNATSLRVYRASDKVTYAVLKTAAVTVTPGNLTITSGSNAYFTVPAGVKVIAVLEDGIFLCGYVGVTPGKTYALRNIPYGGVETEYYGNTIKSGKKRWFMTENFKNADEDFEGDSPFKLIWSEEINAQTPTVTDY